MKKKQKTYLLQGFIFPVDQDGYFPSNPLEENINKVDPFLAIISFNPKRENTGIFFGKAAKYSLKKVFIDSASISFDVEFGTDSIHYYLYRIDPFWTGYYQPGLQNIKKVIKCLVTPIEKNLFDKPETLNGVPFIGESINWEQRYKWHLKGPYSDISCSPKIGQTIRKCSNCFYRNYKGAKDSDCHCGENGNLAKILFSIPNDQFMPEQIDGKEVGRFCCYWRDPAADLGD